ncbi:MULTISPECIES: hypothetical protein [Nocardioides]|uniref:Uncharacterized protein n=1 Tax=Nocardioides vastitatis TaxID=2568655 RepID=A0ABW0ZL40_9ACTN|nr:hypothetical protein [Nocardioides sp.]
MNAPDPAVSVFRVAPYRVDGSDAQLFISLCLFRLWRDQELTD